MRMIDIKLLGTDIYITRGDTEIYDDYLLNGDGEYRISLFAQGEDGSWNDNYYYIPSGSRSYITADGLPYLCMRE